MLCFESLLKSMKKAAECDIQTFNCSFACLTKRQIKTWWKWSASSAMKLCKHFIFTFQFWFLEIIILFFLNREGYPTHLGTILGLCINFRWPTQRNATQSQISYHSNLYTAMRVKEFCVGESESRTFTNIDTAVLWLEFG